MLELANKIVALSETNPVAVVSLIALSAICVVGLALVVVHTAIRQGKRK